MSANNSMNHHHGTVVREQWPIGMKVKFIPKGLVSGEILTGEIVGHIYVNVLVIKTETNHQWKVSTFRCSKIEVKEDFLKSYFFTYIQYSTGKIIGQQINADSYEKAKEIFNRIADVKGVVSVDEYKRIPVQP